MSCSYLQFQSLFIALGLLVLRVSLYVVDSYGYVCEYSSWYRACFVTGRMDVEGIVFEVLFACLFCRFLVCKYVFLFCVVTLFLGCMLVRICCCFFLNVVLLCCLYRL